jgi:hypothetical protein
LVRPHPLSQLPGGTTPDVPCPTRGFCASCHSKRLEEWGEWMRETYRFSQDSETWLLLSTDSEFLKFLKGSQK